MRAGTDLAAGALAATVLRLIWAAAREEAPVRRAKAERGDADMAAEDARLGARAGPTEKACIVGPSRQRLMHRLGLWRRGLQIEKGPQCMQAKQGQEGSMAMDGEAVSPECRRGSRHHRGGCWTHGTCRDEEQRRTGHVSLMGPEV
jgi:hypothetical protein